MPAKPTTPAEAAARHTALMADREWTARYLKGDVAAKAQLDELHRVMVGEPPPAAQSAPEQAAARHKSLLADREFATRYLNGDVAAKAQLDELHLILAKEGGS
jgi:hypothetical protein